MPYPCWYHITDVATLRALLDQRDKWWEEASNACNRVASERDKLRAELKTWQNGCACTDKSKADVLALRVRLAEMEAFILRNSDPCDMNEADTATFHEIGKRLVPQNY